MRYPLPVGIIVFGLGLGDGNPGKFPTAKWIVRGMRIANGSAWNDVEIAFWRWLAGVGQAGKGVLRQRLPALRQAMRFCLCGPGIGWAERVLRRGCLSKQSGAMFRIKKWTWPHYRRRPR